MSISPFSAQHDPEVQDYNFRRAAWKASEKARKQEKKSLRVQSKMARKGALQPAERLGNGRKMRWPTEWMSGSRKPSSSGQVVDEGRVDIGYETDEITLPEALAGWK